MGEIKLDNANNNFLGLSNTKFIEARAYDDNDEAIKTEDVPDNKLQLSEEEIMVEAFKQGLEFVNSDFEKVPIENSDSESETEDEKTFYVLQPINKYHLRPLPAIIGTSEWFDDDKVGLADEVKDEAAQSESESEDENEMMRMMMSCLNRNLRKDPSKLRWCLKVRRLNPMILEMLIPERRKNNQKQGLLILLTNCHLNLAFLWLRN